MDSTIVAAGKFLPNERTPRFLILFPHLSEVLLSRLVIYLNAKRLNIVGSMNLWSWNPPCQSRGDRPPWSAFPPAGNHEQPAKRETGQRKSGGLRHKGHVDIE